MGCHGKLLVLHCQILRGNNLHSLENPAFKKSAEYLLAFCHDTMHPVSSGRDEQEKHPSMGEVLAGLLSLVYLQEE